MSIADIRPPEDVETAIANHRAIEERGVDITPLPSGVWRHRRKDGSVFEAEVTTSRLWFRGRRATLVLAQDVSERRRVLEALRQSEARFRLMFENSPVPIVAARGGKVVLVNGVFVRTFGYENAAALTGRSFLEIIGEREREAVGLRNQARERGEEVSANFETLGRRGDGTEFPMHMSVARVPLPDGMATVAFLTDVSEQRRLEEQLRRSQKMEAVGVLAGGVAHEFNNMLGAILAHAEVARRGLVPGDAVDDDLASIADAATRAAELTRKLLALSRRQILRVEPVDLNALLEDFVRVFGRTVGEDLQVTVRRAPTPLVVDADASQLEQVVLNLCANARQAMPHGGRLTIEARAVRLSGDFAAANPGARTGAYALITVADSGRGMTPETLNRAFEPFYSTRPEGAGLGLSIVHSIVEQHRGFVAVESEPEQGTSFQVYLPLAAPGPVPRVSVVPPEPAGGTETILLAEDEALLRGAEVKALTRLGYQMVVAEDGAQALALFTAHRERIALAVLDVMMPGLSGPEVYLALKRERPDLRAVFTTGYAPDSTAWADVLKERDVVVLSKPFSLRLLAQRIREVLDAARSVGG